MMPPSGTVVDGYLINRAVGRGGSATVYLARDATTGTRVALKVLDEEHRGPDDIERLRREYTFAARFHHPHIVEVIAHREHWLAMQYIDGGNATSLDAVGEQLAALDQIAGALDVVHQDGIVHCDVKPANILVSKQFSSDGAVLVDFGVAHSVAEDMAFRLAGDGAQRFSLDPARRITHSTATRHPVRIRVSLPYAAPEVLVGRMPSGASDQYSLACTAFEMITGTKPFPATTPSMLTQAQLNNSPPLLSRRCAWIPRAADPVIERAMAKDPQRRYGSCAEFIGALSRAIHKRDRGNPIRAR